MQSQPRETGGKTHRRAVAVVEAVEGQLVAGHVGVWPQIVERVADRRRQLARPVRRRGSCGQELVDGRSRRRVEPFSPAATGDQPHNVRDGGAIVTPRKVDEPA